MMKLIFASSVQKVLAAERRALKSYIQDDVFLFDLFLFGASDYEVKHEQTTAIGQSDCGPVA